MGCIKPLTYSHFESVPITGWDKDSILTYTWSIEDTTVTYRVLIEVRHTERYPYQNLWFFINTPHTCHLSPVACHQTPDTIEFYLADERGQWLGKNMNGYITMPVLYEEAYKFDSIGDYTMTIQHGMRTNRLRGISDVGLIITPVAKHQTPNGKE